MNEMTRSRAARTPSEADPARRQSSRPRHTHLACAAAALIGSALLAGCATSANKAADGSASKQGVVAAAPVTIPARSADRLVLTLSGPDTVVQSKDWPEMKREWRETFAEHAKQAGIDYRFEDGKPAAGTSAEDGTLLDVTIDDYYILSIGRRVVLGLMAGSAYIETNVRYLDLRDGHEFGAQRLDQNSKNASHFYANTTPSQVDAIAAAVFANLKRAKDEAMPAEPASTGEPR